MFSAFVTPMAPTRKIMWQLSLKYVLGGSVWRRVPHWRRPTFEIEISSFRPEMKSWTEIEMLNFWSREEESDDLPFDFSSGFINATLWPSPAGSDAREDTPFADAIWRVTRRDGAFFTVEISGLADGRDRLFDALEKMIGVTPDGREERVEPPQDFWKANSVFYAIETIPFGQVRVRVPRNARDPQRFAVATMRNMIGAPEPEHIAVHDYYAGANLSEGLKDDIWVLLQYHGTREE